MALSKSFWDEKYDEGELRWDVGYISTPLKEYFDSLRDKNKYILIPGAGNAYEAEYLFNKGFINVFILDWSRNAIKSFKNRFPVFPDENILYENFFEHHGTYDLIIEQTFFCAIEPHLRQDYAKKIHDLLNRNGKLVGLLFNVELNKDRPPYGGFKEEYIKYFKDYFDLNVFETAYNSIEPRRGRELFIDITKKELPVKELPSG